MIQFPAILANATTRKDGTIKVTLELQEQTAQGLAEIFSLMNKFIYCGVAETRIDKLEIPEIVPEFKGDKSDSQRLRNIMYVYHREKKIEQAFDVWRKQYMEKIINNFKDNI